MGTEGSVAFQFKHCGQLIFAPGTSEDKVMEVALEAGAEDVIADDEGAIEVLTSPADFEAVKNALEAAGLMADMAEVTMRAENTIDMLGDDAAKMQKLLDILEDLDDVQNVFHNATISEKPLPNWKALKHFPKPSCSAMAFQPPFTKPSSTPFKPTLTSTKWVHPLWSRPMVWRQARAL